MPHIKVVTDSACDVPEPLLRQFDVTVVPHTIQWGGETYLDGVNITTEQVLRRLRSEPQSWPHILPPSVEDFTRVYRLLRETCDGVLSVHVSGKLSDAAANASVAREAFGPIGQGGPFPIAVVDSQSLSMGLGWLVLGLASAAEAGVDLPRLASLGTRMAQQVHFAFFTERLDGLLRSGRAPRLTGQPDNLSAMRPLLHLDEGQVTIYERTRTRPKARDALYNFVEDFPKIGELAVLHTGAQLDLEHLMTRVGAIYPRDRVLIAQPGATVAALLGPEALGVAVMEGED